MLRFRPVIEPVEIVLSSDLTASAEEVWAHATTMEGVNAELGPWVRMSVPGEARGLGLADAHTGEVLFHSWLLAGGVVPFDRHALRLEAIGPGRRFLERSTTWMQADWEHERTVEEREGGGCRVTDRLRVVPRVGVLAPVVRRVVTALFARRHRRLRRWFGEG